MIDGTSKVLSIERQCQLVSISRSGYYYQPAGETELNLRLIRLIDEQHMKTPFYGSRQMARHLCRQGYVVGRKRVRRLMAKHGVGRGTDLRNEVRRDVLRGPGIAAKLRIPVKADSVYVSRRTALR